MNRIALVIGSTGLVGRELVGQLLADPHYTEVHCFTRRTSGLVHPNLTEHVVDFDNPEKWSALLKGDVLFSCMGTTLKTAGSKEVQWKIDYDYQYNAALMASNNKVPVYVLISAAGANANSRMFYNRMKGELENAVAKLSFSNVRILRPSFLDGQRVESRPGEKIGIAVARIFRFIPGLREYRPVRAEIVAKAMECASRKDPEKRLLIYSPGSLFELAS
jgi:uncharacterized protein YbjT (DUF2867 family)